ncbi:MAG: hypothetical protein AAB600_03610 [Patescibacteria group bacterium]
MGTFILLGRALHVLTGEHPDLLTSSRLPGSRYEGTVPYYATRMVYAMHFPDGSITVGKGGWEASFRHDKLGGRFEVNKKT